jgi:hypothetical protein
MAIQYDGDPFAILLELAGYMFHFKQRLPNTDEVNPLKQYSLTKGNTLRYPSSFSDQVVDKFISRSLIISKRTVEY